MVAKTKWRNGGWAWTRIKKLAVARDRMANDGFQVCEHCGAHEMDNLSLQFAVDHIVPCSKGGAELDLDNVWTVCKPCNDKFGAKRKSPEVEARALAMAYERNRIPDAGE